MLDEEERDCAREGMQANNETEGERTMRVHARARLVQLQHVRRHHGFEGIQLKGEDARERLATGLSSAGW